MLPPTTAACYKHHRFPAEMLRHGVWLSFRIGSATVPSSFQHVRG